MKITRWFFYSLLLVTVSFAQADETLIEEGKELHDEYECSNCHTTRIYTRKNRRVTNLNKLGSQVLTCDNELGLGLLDEEIDALVAYLNNEYYKFCTK